MDIPGLKNIINKITNKKLRLNKRSVPPSGCYPCMKTCLGHITIKCKRNGVQHAVGRIQTRSCSVIFCEKKANIKVFSY